MKVLGKWLIMAGHEGDTRSRIALSFSTKKEAIERLDHTFKGNFGKKISENLWQDRMGQLFWIEKNTKEYV